MKTTKRTASGILTAALVLAALTACSSNETPADPELLGKLKAALEDYDIGAIDELAAAVGNREISACVLSADYDGAVAVIDAVLEKAAM
jgi:hypothetical protein